MSYIRSKIILTLLGLGLALIVIFSTGIYSKGDDNKKVRTQSQAAELTSTNPSPLEQAVILPDQAIILNFSQPILNKDEIKFKLDPPHPLTVTLSADKRSATITPQKPYTLGVGYTLSISSDSNFEVDGVKTPLGKQYLYHFKTISYKGV